MQIKSKVTDWKEFESLSSIVREQLKRDNPPRKKQEKIKFYPAYIGNCLRAIYYAMMGYEKEDMDPRILAILENGNYFHERMEKLFERTGLLIAPELRIVDEELKISGRTDAVVHNWLPFEPSENIVTLMCPPPKNKPGEKPKIVWTGPDNAAIMIELKSISSNGFKYIMRDGPKKDHILQLQLYLDMTGLKIGILYYENKDNQQRKDFVVQYDPELAAAAKEKIKLSIAHAEADIIPEREYDINDFECIFCDYRYLCRDIEKPLNPEEILALIDN